MDLLEEVGIESLDEEPKKIAELVGMEGFRNLVRTFGGSSIYIPKVESLEKAVRDQRIRDEFDGSNYRELAMKYGLDRDVDKEYCHGKGQGAEGKAHGRTDIPV